MNYLQKWKPAVKVKTGCNFLELRLRLHVQSRKPGGSLSVSYRPKSALVEGCIFDYDSKIVPTQK